MGDRLASREVKQTRIQRLRCRDLTEERRGLGRHGQRNDRSVIGVCDHLGLVGSPAIEQQQHQRELCRGVGFAFRPGSEFQLVRVAESQLSLQQEARHPTCVRIVRPTVGAEQVPGPGVVALEQREHQVVPSELSFPRLIARSNKRPRQLELGARLGHHRQVGVRFEGGNVRVGRLIAARRGTAQQGTGA